MKKFIILITVGISFFIVPVKSYSQGADDVLKLRAFKASFIPAGASWPDYKDLKDCDVLIVTTVKDSRLEKVNIYSKEEQDYDIVYKLSESTSSDGDVFEYTAIDNKGIKVKVRIDITGSLPKLWGFTIYYQSYTIYYLTKY